MASLRIGVDAGVFRSYQAGIARYVRSMLCEMMKQAPSHRFHLYATRPVDPGLPDGNWELHVDRGRPLRPITLWMQARLPELLARDRIQVFWGQNHMLPLHMRHRCARLLTLHDLTPLLFPGTMHYTTRLSSGGLLASAARKADLLIGVSEATANLAVRLLRVKRSKVRVVYEGSGVAGSGDSDHESAPPFDLPRDFVLTVGTVEPRKDHEVLLKALDDMREGPFLVVAGGVGWRCSAVFRRLRRFEEAGRGRYVGRVDDECLSWLYRNARLMVYPSKYEGFGLPVVEAMSHGCPVVCSWSSSLPEVGGRAARYFRVGDAEGLARLLGRLLTDGRELSRMARQGIEQARQFSFSVAADKTMELMQEAVTVRSRFGSARR